eukprot:jgi/Chlat1/1348/Chrsp119S01770
MGGDGDGGRLLFEGASRLALSCCPPLLPSLPPQMAAPLPDGLARRVRSQAAAVVARTLAADATGKGGAGLKRMVLGAEGVQAKKATYKLCCETLRFHPLLQQLLELTGVIKYKRKMKPGLLEVLAYELLLGQASGAASLGGIANPSGPAESLIAKHASALKSALARAKVKARVSDASLLLPETAAQHSEHPRYVRVNTLRVTLDEARRALESEGLVVTMDPHIQNLLVLPAGTDLHNHALVQNGSIILQASPTNMASQVACQRKCWTHSLAGRYGHCVLDACAAPGNKTTHLAALMGGKGSITAVDADAKRLELLKATVKLAGANIVKVVHGDFLKLDPNSKDLCEARFRVQAILLDPSCSGSGTVARRLDRLLPSSQPTATADTERDARDAKRVEQLAKFQEAALRHALSFPGVTRVVYSTCSIHERENEGVVAAVLLYAAEQGFQPEKTLPEWPRRGLPGTPHGDCFVRVDAEEHQTDGFFVALFVRQGHGDDGIQLEGTPDHEALSSAQASRLRRRKLKRMRKRQVQVEGSC